MMEVEKWSSFVFAYTLKILNGCGEEDILYIAGRSHQFFRSSWVYNSFFSDACRSILSNSLHCEWKVIFSLPCKIFLKIANAGPWLTDYACLNIWHITSNVCQKEKKYVLFIFNHWHITSNVFQKAKKYVLFIFSQVMSPYLTQLELHRAIRTKHTCGNGFEENWDVELSHPRSLPSVGSVGLAKGFCEGPDWRQT